MEGRSRSGVPQEVRPVVPVTTSSPRLSFRARSSHIHEAATAERAFNLDTIIDRMYMKIDVKDGMG